MPSTPLTIPSRPRSVRHFAVACAWVSVCEIVAARRPALLVPRIRLRAEQSIRAERLAQLGIVDAADLETLSERSLSDWLHTAVLRPALDLTVPLDLDGLQRVPELADRVMAPRSAVRGAA